MVLRPALIFLSLFSIFSNSVNQVGAFDVK